MRTSRQLGTVVALVASCAISLAVIAEASGLEISNLKSGLVCEDADGNYEVCGESEKIDIDGSEICDMDGRQAPCTWYGFSFDYEPIEEDVVLDCLWSSSDLGTQAEQPEAVEVEVKKSPFELTIAAEETFFINPLFSTRPQPLRQPGKRTRVSTECSLDGSPVLDVTFELHYPAD